MTRRSAATTGARTGTALLVAFYLAACSGSSEPEPTVASVEVTPTSANLEVGETAQLGAAVKDADGNLMQGQPVSWSTSAASVATVSSAGLVTAVTIGTATITAAAGNRSGVSTITVIPEPIASISVAPTNDTLLVGQTLSLSTTMRDNAGNLVTGRTIAWSSASPNVATVSSAGLVTAIDDGFTTVTASVDGVSAAASIRVFGPCSTALAPAVTVGQTINAALASTDCRLLDNTFLDGYALLVTATTNVQIEMTATFDTYLFLIDLLPNGDPNILAENDDIDPDDPNIPNDPVNTNSRITFTLVAGHQYFILANSFDPNVFGDYQLNVVATGPLVARQAGYTKPGKAPASKLLQSIRPAK